MSALPLLSLLLLGAASTPLPARQGGQEIDLRSETLTVDHRKHEATFGGGVVVTRGDLVVRCPTLVAHYDSAAKIREVVCEGPVDAVQGERTMSSRAGSFDNRSGLLSLEGETTLVDAERRFTGESLVFETGTNLATLAHARAELPAEEMSDPGGLPIGSGPLFITAEKVVHDFSERRTTFVGEVVAKRSDLVMKAPRLVVLGKEGGAIDRAWTEGGPVHVTQGARHGTAQRARFASGGQRLILEGDPIVTENDSSLRGERVTFFVGLGRVEVMKPRAVFPLREAERRVQP